MYSKIKKEINIFKNKFIQVFPVIVFFIILFYSIYFIFGIHYLIIVSCITLQFKSRYQKKQTIRSLLSMFIVQLLLCVLACLATYNLFFCVLMNIIVPFFLVFLQSSQFNPKGYFTNAMGFVFLQLRPVDWAGFLSMLQVVIYGMSFCVFALLCNEILQKKEQNFQVAKTGLLLLSQSFTALSQGEENSARIEKLFEIQQSLNKLANQNRGKYFVVTGEGKIYHMFALLFQRTMYYMTQYYKDDPSFHKRENDLQKFADYLKLASNFNQENNDVLISQGKLLTKSYIPKEDALSLVTNHSLNLLLLILKEITLLKDHIPQSEWKLPKYRRPLQSIRHRLRLDSFELRFALRLSAVLVIGFIFSKLSGLNHAYWLPLNAFLLLQPIYEESNKRLKTRFIGTVIGCSVIYFLLPIFAGLSGHFLFAIIMIAFMYCSTPGTWNQALFSTCFALTLASLAIQQNMIIQLRLFYVVLAIILVLVVNRFLFPMDAKRQFEDNINSMFHLQHSYLRILQSCIHEIIDYGVICDALLSFHRTYEQIEGYLKKYGSEKEQKYYRHMLALLWRMVSEMEQMLFLVNNRKILSINETHMYEYIHICDYVLHTMQAMSHMKDKTTPKDITHMQVHLEIKGEPYFSNLLRGYTKNISALYQMVLKNTLH
ncbi:MAG: FUSC family protein [Lachnospiraceae bacterium]